MSDLPVMRLDAVLGMYASQSQGGTGTHCMPFEEPYWCLRLMPGDLEIKKMVWHMARWSYKRLDVVAGLFIKMTGSRLDGFLCEPVVREERWKARRARGAAAKVESESESRIAGGGRRGSASGRGGRRTARGALSREWPGEPRLTDRAKADCRFPKLQGPARVIASILPLRIELDGLRPALRQA